MPIHHPVRHIPVHSTTTPTTTKELNKQTVCLASRWTAALGHPPVSAVATFPVQSRTKKQHTSPCLRKVLDLLKQHCVFPSGQILAKNKGCCTKCPRERSREGAR